MFEEITGALVSGFDFVFLPLAAFNPVVSLFIVSVLITALILLLNRLTIKQSVLKEIKDSIQQIRENLTKAQKEGDKESTNKFLKQLLEMNNQYMKQSSKALIVSLVVIALFLPWLNVRYDALAIGLPFTGFEVQSLRLPVIGSEIKAWIVWYILVSFAIGWVVRKLLGMD